MYLYWYSGTLAELIQQAGLGSAFAGHISFLKGETKHALLFVACFFLLSSALGQSFNLFDTDEVMELTLRGDLKTVFKDRGDDSQYHPATLHYQADHC